ncbi:hypothetical protein RUM43_008509, partial [Polyplax serrata]
MRIRDVQDELFHCYAKRRQKKVTAKTVKKMRKMRDGGMLLTTIARRIGKITLADDT